MTNDLYRARLRDSVRVALQQFDEATQLDHPGLTGRVREIAVGRIIEPFLFDHLRVGHGKVTDYLGGLSGESDCIVYSTRHLPPLMYDENLGVFPLDAVFAFVEIKSRLSATTLREAYDNAVTVCRLRPSTGRYVEQDGRRIDLFTPPVAGVFAFQSDLTGGGKTEIQRYFGIDSEGRVRPTVQTLCVVGQGFWWYKYRHYEDRGAWVFCKPTDNHDEVIAFLAHLLSMIVGRSRERPPPSIEGYLVDIRVPDRSHVKE